MSVLDFDTPYSVGLAVFSADWSWFGKSRQLLYLVPSCFWSLLVTNFLSAGRRIFLNVRDVRRTIHRTHTRITLAE
jgi:hypothetical protein